MNRIKEVTGEAIEAVRMPGTVKVILMMILEGTEAPMLVWCCASPCPNAIF